MNLNIESYLIINPLHGAAGLQLCSALPQLSSQRRRVESGGVWRGVSDRWGEDMAQNERNVNVKYCEATKPFLMSITGTKLSQTEIHGDFMVIS